MGSPMRFCSLTTRHIHTSTVLFRLICFISLTAFQACINLEDISLQSTNDILVVDGTLTNRAEPQVIRLNRSRADRLSGRFQTFPITGATVEIVVDSSEQVTCHETQDGSYQLPSDFKGLVSHAYQLRFQLSDGTSYISTQQVMQPIPPITTVTAQFNPTSLSSLQLTNYTAGHDLFIDSQDPVEQHNYYRWEWRLYERQSWCKSCRQGTYSYYKVLPGVYKDKDYFVTGTEPFEDCFTPPSGISQADPNAPVVPQGNWIYDYPCRNACWEIIYGYDQVVFDDVHSNGGLISRKPVAHIPFYDYQPALVDIRQLSLTADAYQYYKLFADQNQQSSGLADSPPTALGGNVHQVDRPQVALVGYFTVSAVSQVHYWLDRKDTQGLAYGATGSINTTPPKGSYVNSGDYLFYSLNGRQPNPEPSPPLGEREKAKVRLWPNADRPPTAPCLQSDNRTPYKPEGWRD
ncbi:DUF4249 domain-containing protein [Spirosoma sp. KNUC1025]|uniref:DUF4249 domain-containing protein n=1 Tax=Spirosoma sp. KNUC1025 TaxID=2894082 RepID=UPI00386E5B66|nr:DUF4249 domain-containing protein [Spirosoma sp. KNUC1025]